jgi:hypothetical protein
MRLEILHVPDCPSVAVLLERLAWATAGRADVEISLRLVEDAGTAAELGMRGSPTLLVDGADPYADLAQPTSVSCRLYRDAGGGLGGAPSVASLQAVLAGRNPAAG